MLLHNPTKTEVDTGLREGCELYQKIYRKIK